MAEYPQPYFGMLGAFLELFRNELSNIEIGHQVYYRQPQPLCSLSRGIWPGDGYNLVMLVPRSDYSFGIHKCLSQTSSYFEVPQYKKDPLIVVDLRDPNSLDAMVSIMRELLGVAPITK